MVSHDITIPQGTTWSLDLVYKRGTAPVSLTGAQARMQLRTSYDAPTAAISLTQASGITLGGTAGTIVVALTDAQTAALPAGRYVYDLELIESGKVTRLIEGVAICTPEVTR
jgi:hypothetical protein